MQIAIKGYYDGNNIVIDESFKERLSIGDELEISIVNKDIVSEDVIKRRKEIIASDKYVKPTGRSTEEVDNYIREMLQRKE